MRKFVNVKSTDEWIWMMMQLVKEDLTVIFIALINKDQYNEDFLQGSLKSLGKVVIVR